MRFQVYSKVRVYLICFGRKCTQDPIVWLIEVTSLEMLLPNNTGE